MMCVGSSAATTKKMTYYINGLISMLTAYITITQLSLHQYGRCHIRLNTIVSIDLYRARPQNETKIRYLV